MFHGNILGSGNLSCPQTEASLAVLQAQCPLAALDGQHSSGSKSAAPRLCCTAGHMAGLEAKKRMGLRRFCAPHITGTVQGMLWSRLRHCCTSVLAAVWEDNPLPVSVCLQHLVSEEVKSSILSFPEQKIFRILFPQKGKTFLGFIPIQNENCLETSAFPHRKKMPWSDPHQP